MIPPIIYDFPLHVPVCMFIIDVCKYLSAATLALHDFLKLFDHEGLTGYPYEDAWVLIQNSQDAPALGQHVRMTPMVKPSKQAKAK